MSNPSAGKTLFFLICWFLAGAAALAGATWLVQSLLATALEPYQIWLSVIFGGLAGGLFGHARLRLKDLSHRLATSDSRLQLFSQKTPAKLHATDDQGRLIFASKAWLDTLGYEAGAVIGRDFFDLVIADDIPALRKDHFRRLNESGEIKGASYLLRHASGQAIEILLTEVAQRDQDGQWSGTLAVLTDFSSQRATEERIERLAYFDALTGLPNRTLLHDRLLQSMALARRDNRQVGVFFFDLDRFKLINDTQGHAVGDLVLRSVAQRLKRLIREGDTFARLGGDEFVIVQADPNHDPNFTTLGRRILETLGKPFRVGSREFFTTASIGVSIYPIDGEDAQDLLKSADTAMYVAKSRGRNNVQFFSNDMNAEALAKTELESRLRQALTNGEAQLHYQPLINLGTGRIAGVEALLRCYDEHGNLIPPQQIIRVAEESGLVFPLGEWVMKTACAQARAWQVAGLDKIRMAVNLSGHHIRQVNFIDRVEEILNETGLEPEFLEIELAENSIMGHVEDSILALTDLKVRGIGLAIDDFGTGYSSLLYLKHFPIHRIKIAREFISEITRNRDYAAITEAILSMAGRLNILVTAVGVEHKEQLEFLQQRGCQEIQGQVCGSPMSAEQMTRFLKTSGTVLRPTGRSGNQEVFNSGISNKIH